MERYLTKENVKKILSEAPAGVSQTQVLRGLVSAGFVIEGLNDDKQGPKTTLENIKEGFQSSAVGQAYSAAQNVGRDVYRGVEKQLVGDIVNVGELGNRALNAVVAPVVSAVTGTPRKTAEQDERVIEQLPEIQDIRSTKNIAEGVGRFGASVMEFVGGSAFAQSASAAASAAWWSKLPAVQQVIARVAGKALFEATMAAGISEAQTKSIKQALISGGLAGGMSVAADLIVAPLTKAAQKMYQSGLKPSTKLGAEGTKRVVETGLDEKIWLNAKGVEAVSTRIDDFEQQLDDVIRSAQENGMSINTRGVIDYIDEAKKLFANNADVAAAEKAVQQLDDLGKNFIAKYGDDMSIEVAQQVKVATGNILRKYYGEMSGVNVEGSKQIVRYLKDEIADAAPVVGEINKRLKALYEFDKELSRAAVRIQNLNLLGISTKVVAGIASVPGAGGKAGVLAALSQLIDAPSIKSGAAIMLNEISKDLPAISVKASVILNALKNLLVNERENMKK